MIFFKRIFFQTVLLLLTVFQFAQVADAAWPNSKLVITDLLDDDIRALIHLLSDPKTENTIEAIAVSTGNTELKAEIARNIVFKFGKSIPIFVGSSTDLSDNPVTHFAANFEAEGRHILDEHLRWFLKERYGESGTAAVQIYNLMKSHSPNNRLDVLCLTAPLDLVQAIQMGPEQAKQSLGDLFVMGLYKKTAADRLISPFNTMANPKSVFELMHLFQSGIFEKIYHVPSDMVQLRSGLPGGYFPEDYEGKILRAKLTRIMEKHSSLDVILTAAKEYGISWWSSAAQQFGTGLTTDSRWISPTLKDVKESAGFYIADTIPALLSNLDKQQLNRLDTNNTYVLPPVNSESLNLSQPFFFDLHQVSTIQPLRPFIDLYSYDGKTALKEHLELLEQASDQMHGMQFTSTHLNINPETKLNALVTEHHLHTKGLVLTFKNSPDDWFALVRVISTQKGRAALAMGGVICEGFETKAQATVVKLVLEKLGLDEILVAAGYEYTEKDVAGISNFKGELAFYKYKQAFRAFDHLPGVRESLIEKVLTPEALLIEAEHKSKQANTELDLMILGEGIDIFNYAIEHPQFLKIIDKAYLMGGGRLLANQKINFTRNWIVHRTEILKGIEQMGQAGVKAYVFSTNEFGGMLVARTDGPIGNGSVAFSALEEFSNREPVIHAISQHWMNWTRSFDWIIKGEVESFDPDLPLNTVTISPLGLHIADAWSADFIEVKKPDWQLEEFSSLTLLSESEVKKAVHTNAFWIKQKGGQKIEPLSLRFKHAIEKLVDTAEARELDSALRETAIFSDEAKEARKKVLLNDSNLKKCNNTLHEK